MSEPGLPDFLALQRDLLSQWEKALNELMVQQMSTPEFSKQANQLLTAGAPLKRSMEELKENAIATKGDVGRLEQRMKAIEDQLERAIVLLERAMPEEEGVAPTHSVARTKRFSSAKSVKS
jgi:type VI protein secretion system component VasK